MVGVSDQRSAAIDQYLDHLTREELIEFVGRLIEGEPGAADLVRAEVVAAGLADTLGQAKEQRQWAVETAEELAGGPYGSGADLISIYLTEGLVEQAWSVADRFGAGSAWKVLADASATSRPREAAWLYRPQIDAKLVNADTRIYPEVARMLADMRSLAEAAGDLSSFEDYLADVRSRYARRTSLIKALQAKRV